MDASFDLAPVYRELGAREVDLVRTHLLRLGRNSRTMRFGYAVSDEFIENYCSAVRRLNIMTFGALVDGELRAVAELRRVSDARPADAEVALSVEDAWQDDGIGTRLLSHVRRSARYHGIATLHMICLRENYRMRCIAQKYRARTKTLADQIGADAPRADLDCLPVASEWRADKAGFVTFALDV